MATPAERLLTRVGPLFDLQGTDEGAMDYGLNRALDAYYNNRAWFHGLQKRVMEQVGAPAACRGSEGLGRRPPPGIWRGWRVMPAVMLAHQELIGQLGWKTGAGCKLRMVVLPKWHLLHASCCPQHPWLSPRLQDWSWNKPAHDYIELYHAALRS